ncbi:BPTI/Kunitz inhibitor domain-containing protein [Aphelenchoides besseyi]|nr:BPTI/Kunitz inhibitor domain-containing protein [Aphelenchoides besseyi]KAI6199806.1 BPTI/Kunitz inhibitor domain-containing protein [Aphelenchoides besseyi]
MTTVAILFLSVLCACATVKANESNPSLPDPPIFPSLSVYPSSCYLPPDSGSCDTEEERAKLRKHANKKIDQKIDVRYYFDSITENCYPFSFYRAHCSKNANNFSSLAKCQSYCVKST